MFNFIFCVKMEENNNNKRIMYIKWDIGSHSKFSKSIYNTLKESIEYGMTSTQFFLGNPKTLNRHRVEHEDITKCLKIIKRFPLNVFSHFPYLSNLVGSVKQLAWEGDNEQDDKTKKLITELEYELDILSKLKTKNNIVGTVIHPGNFKDRNVGIKNIAKNINKIKFSKNSKLLLENAAGQGCSLATTFKEIKEIIDNIDNNKQKHIGVCVDTAHIFGYGEYDISKTSEVLRMFKEFDEIIGKEKFTLLHLNDSKVPLGSRKDNHELIGKGFIWGESLDSLFVLLNECKKRDIPAILETNNTDMFFLASIS